MVRRGARPTLRLIALLCCMTLALTAVGVRLIHLQVVRASSFEDLGAKQRIRRTELPAHRGAIYDRNGVPLAVSIDARAIFANPQFVIDPGGTAGAVAKALGMQQKEILERLRRRKSGFVYLARKVDVAAAARVTALALPGIGTLPETRRVNPQGTLAGQVLGFVGMDDVGLSGVEAGLNKVLAGRSGEEVIEQDPRGRPIAHGLHTVRRPVRGQDIVLTIDRDVQFQAERALEEAVRKTGANDGTAVVIDARTNEILAMANYPPFNPMRFAEMTAAARRNRAVQDAYEPGSVNKLVTAAAALESGMVRPSDRMHIPDSIRVGNDRFADFKSHEPWFISYADAIGRSSNVGSIQVALKIGARRLHDMIVRFGLGQKTGVEFPGENPGISLPLQRWSRTSIATIPIGQGIAVTPLQMFNVYTTIARDGMWLAPRLVRLVGGEQVPARRPPRRVISTFTAAQLRAMLLNVVENGTGKSARIPGHLIGGKTGTARKPLLNRRGYSSDVITTFVGMVPVDKPRFVIGVALDSPFIHQAAATAAPAFQRITSFVLARWGVPPSLTIAGVDARTALRPAPWPPKPAPATTALPTAQATVRPRAPTTPRPSTSPSPRPST